MFVGGVVEHEVDGERDAVRPEVVGDLSQVVHRPELRGDLPVAGHRVAAVGVLRRREEEGHQVQVGQPEFAEVGDAVAQTLQRPGVPVDVAHAPEHPVRLEPGRIGEALPVELFQFGRARLPRRREVGEKAAELGFQTVVFAVDLPQEPLEPRGLACPALSERLPRRILEAGFRC